MVFDDVKQELAIFECMKHLRVQIADELRAPDDDDKRIIQNREKKKRKTGVRICKSCGKPGHNKTTCPDLKVPVGDFSTNEATDDDE